MAEKIMEFGTAGFPGESVMWRGRVDETSLGAAETTDFHMEVTRPVADGPLNAPGLTLKVLLFGEGVSIRPGPIKILGIHTGYTLKPGQTISIDFQITNDPGGATPATYTLLSFIEWDNGGVTVGPISSPAFTAP